ncbi:hypothetical protein Hanom_Chr12g01154411 [Helianthus anomalus]
MLQSLEAIYYASSGIHKLHSYRYITYMYILYLLVIYLLKSSYRKRDLCDSAIKSFVLDRLSPRRDLFGEKGAYASHKYQNPSKYPTELQVSECPCPQICVLGPTYDRTMHVTVTTMTQP